MNTVDNTSIYKPVQNFRFVAGAIFVFAGGVLLIDQYARTGWLSLTVMPLVGLFLYIWGIRLRHTALLVTGGVLGGLGVGIAAAFNPGSPDLALITQVGYILAFLALGFALVVVGTVLCTARLAWWAFVSAGIASGLSLGLLLSPFNAFNLVFYLALGIGLPLMIWGISSRLFGLIIPGCIVTTTGAGIYMAWGLPQESNGLLSTGVMLIWFAFGWVLMTFFSRILFNKFAWWPLIPGGILAMVGFGLYIGGDPDNALGFIGNTGSIALMIFGLYLLLMRKGIHQ